VVEATGVADQFTTHDVAVMLLTLAAEMVAAAVPPVRKTITALGVKPKLNVPSIKLMVSVAVPVLVREKVPTAAGSWRTGLATTVPLESAGEPAGRIERFAVAKVRLLF
jgi:hypothetical protein